MPQIAKHKKVVKRNHNSYSVKQKKMLFTYMKNIRWQSILTLMQV
jgi:hypothetical protein